MKLLPFFLTAKQEKLTVTKLCMFLSHGGKGLWQIDDLEVTEDTVKKEYLIPNGFVPKQIHIKKDIVYCLIDAEKTNLEDFYTWEEAYKHPQRPECWRSFYFFKTIQGTDWFTPVKGEGEIEGVSVQTYYEDILRHFTN